MECYKYHGAGNDFVIIDNRTLFFDKKNAKAIQMLCDRRFGIGADGLILLENDTESDFKMVYFNADGYESTMCGNGGRCIVAFAKKINIIKQKTQFMAIDGVHFAEIDDLNQVNLQMKAVDEIEVYQDDFILDTGSPHYVKHVSFLEDDFVAKAKAIRHQNRFDQAGINVNFVEKIDENTLKIRTFERGVEDETLACGTGCVAAALSTMPINDGTYQRTLLAKGGVLKVSATKKGPHFTNVWLWGPTAFVFKATYNDII